MASKEDLRTTLKTGLNQDMKITLTIEDTESGHVKFHTDPTTDVMVKIAKGEGDKMTPALDYAMRAVSQMMKKSLEQGQQDGIIPFGKIRPVWTPPRRRA